MALPVKFEEPIDYFTKCLQCFKEYQYLFKFPNTDLLTENVLECIEIDEIDFTINESCDLRSTVCNYLDTFFEKFDRLKSEYTTIKHTDLDFLLNVPLSPKKKHEITYLAKEIKDFCEEINCETVVDFGSGLGYLDQQLYETTNLNVLGLECNENNYVAAKRRQRKYHINSLSRVKYIKHTINENSKNNIEEYLCDKFLNCDSFCITGLHACADLTIDAINIFLNSKTANGLVIMSCCYHRMISDNGRFKNFPLSDALKECCDENSLEILSIPFLRLAAQTSTLGTKIEDSVFNLLARAVLQVYAFKNNLILKRTKRKAVRLKSVKNNFEDYVQDALTGYQLIRGNGSNNTENINFDVEEIISIWRELPELTFKKAAIFVLLQNYLQPVFENFILYDRLIYLQERGILSCKYKKIVDNNISPRCLALIVKKH
ncbi:unnamed protein product [Danaus chrysippus]|uniref:(African queen) hypothetical protein n=1 Tax=Danaus chrysippus TaxID=151541 RepID=A0A8J2W0L0_9NEOP|nr:unnamed protein product [Danaus chrysippus]